MRIVTVGCQNQHWLQAHQEGYASQPGAMHLHVASQFGHEQHYEAHQQFQNQASLLIHHQEWLHHQPEYPLQSQQTRPLYLQGERPDIQQGMSHLHHAYRLF